MEPENVRQKSSRRTAIIGLIGTLLTVCGGLAGALIGGVTTIYRIQREAQKIAIAAPKSDTPLMVDTHQINITSSQADALNPSAWMVFPGEGFVLAQPSAGWKNKGQMTYLDLFLEEGTNLSPMILFSTWIDEAWDDQPVRRIRYLEPVIVQFLEGSSENGLSVDPTQLISDTIAFYSQITVLALSREVAGEEFNPYKLALTWGGLHQGGVNEIITDPRNLYVYEQVSWEIKGVRVDGQPGDLALQRWALFAENADRYFIVEVQYAPSANQPTRIWDDLQLYLDSFRVIQ
jgi:hypothetical protein